jgi:hypothetical protein
MFAAKIRQRRVNGMRQHTQLRWHLESDHRPNKI